MKELSIFVDESGDFGEYAQHALYYISYEFSALFGCLWDICLNRLTN